MEAVRPPWPGAYREIDGRRVFIRCTPAQGDNAEPALFVHGLGGSSTNWTDFAALLADRLEVEALDLPGFGRSDPAVDGDYHLDTFVRAVGRVVETRGVGPVHLAGNSLGGAICVRLAAERPDLVRSLTLVSPALPALRPQRGLDQRLALLLVPGARRLARRVLEQVSPADRARALLQACYADPGRIAPQRLTEVAREVSEWAELTWYVDAFGGALRGLVGSYFERGPRALWRQAAGITVPTLIIWGRRDALVAVQLAPRAHQLIRGSRLLVLEECGHVAQMEHPETAAAAVRELLDARLAAH